MWQSGAGTGFAFAGPSSSAPGGAVSGAGGLDGLSAITSARCGRAARRLTWQICKRCAGGAISSSRGKIAARKRTRRGRNGEDISKPFDGG